MANIELDWEVKGMIQADESVKDMLKVIGEKNENDSGTFWCWNGKVSDSLRIHSGFLINVILNLMIFRHTRGDCSRCLRLCVIPLLKNSVPCILYENRDICIKAREK